jgi:formate C-acetyltransferase
MKSFEDVKKALADQVANSINVMVELTDIKDQVIAEFFPTPLLSSTIEGCVESGMDVTRGGARHNHSTACAQGIATTANSMAAIKWAVFDKKLVTMEEMIQHLRNNFAGAEDLRQQLLNKAPKYGTSNPEADDIALWIMKLADTESRKHKRPMDGGTYRTCMISAGTQVMGGRILGATPDGRKAGEAVSNGISPANGTETQGMTAALHSVAKISEPRFSGGTALNMTLNPSSIKTDEGLEKFAFLVEGYFELGGRQVQFNPVNRQILLEAQKKREAYPDLMVRVSGYSYRFIDLSRGLQDDIIARTEFTI